MEIYQVVADDGVDKYNWLFVAKDNDDACHKAKRNLVEMFKRFNKSDRRFFRPFGFIISRNFQIQSCKLDKKW